MENSARKLLAIIGVLILFIIAGLFTTNTTVFADTEVSYLAYNTTTPNADVPQNAALDESELSDEDIAAIEKFWEEYGCIGLVVIIIDAFMLFDFIFVILYLLQNKKHPDRKSIKASKILRFIGLASAILALIFAIVAIIIHQCTFSTIGIAWAAINVILFAGSYLVKFKKDEIYG